MLLDQSSSQIIRLQTTPRNHEETLGQDDYSGGGQVGPHNDQVLVYYSQISDSPREAVSASVGDEISTPEPDLVAEDVEDDDQIGLVVDKSLI